jgi:cell division protein ZapA
MSNLVKVQIYGQSYTLGGELDEAYVQQLAQYVDQKMNAVAAATSAVDSARVAVLAAMAIADEYHTLRHEKRTRDAALRARAEQCLSLVDRALTKAS